jgi:hypothetical protein
MEDGKTITFAGLFKEVDRVHIPILQRDYAQGRVEALHVRQQFLASIQQTLSIEPSELQQPLDLDFVYGNFDGEEKSFSVLDGQQRLTTLFLLHWYLAAKENKTKEFIEQFVINGNSRFTYKTRTSAAEFFKVLATTNAFSFRCGHRKLSEQIVEQRWFYLSWQYDPTVQSCLRMLDAIDEVFENAPEGLYERITNTKSPYIVFQFLNLESFGLSDELYIKMNARGKPLTDFENFKAWFCNKVSGSERGEIIENKLDQSWTDIFWNLSLDAKLEFDELYLRFFNLMAFYNACENTDSGFDLLADSEKNWLRNLRVSKTYINTADFENNDSFNSSCLYRIERVLDYFYAHRENSDKLDVLKKVLTETDYVSQAKFYAMCLFIASDSPYADWTPDNEAALRWARVTGNLIDNHRIDELASYLPAIKALSTLSNNIDNLYEYLATEGIDSGFNREQRLEECLKAELILDDEEWDETLRKYESHTYLKGKVGFLLDLANDEEDCYSIELFNQYASKATLLLSDNILQSNKFLLQRALLALDDYLVNKGSGKYSFCLPYRQTYRQRSENWLKVVSQPVFTELLCKINDNIEQSLNNIIEEANCGGWRQLLVKTPLAIAYCKGEDSGRNSGRLVSIANNVLYLLSKTTFNGYHVELRTYVLKLYLDNQAQQEALPAPIDSHYYIPEYNNLHPRLKLTFTDETSFYLAFDSRGFFAFDGADEEGKPITVEIPKELKVLLSELFPEEVIYE